LSHWERSVYEEVVKLNPDVIHAHDLPALRLGVSLKKTLNRPLVYDAHEIYPFQPGYDAETKDRLCKMEKALIAHSDVVTVINEDQAEFMMKEYVPFRYIVLTNATSYPEGYQPGRKYNIIREKLGIKDCDRIILFQGGI